MSEPSLSPEEARLARKEQRRKRRQRKRLLSLLFAALGVFALLRQTGKDLAGDSYVELR